MHNTPRSIYLSDIGPRTSQLLFPFQHTVNQYSTVQLVMHLPQVQREYVIYTAILRFPLDSIISQQHGFVLSYLPMAIICPWVFPPLILITTLSSIYQRGDQIRRRTSGILAALRGFLTNHRLIIRFYGEIRLVLADLQNLSEKLAGHYFFLSKKLSEPRPPPPPQSPPPTHINNSPALNT